MNAIANELRKAGIDVMETSEEWRSPKRIKGRKKSKYKIPPTREERTVTDEIAIDTMAEMSDIQPPEIDDRDPASRWMDEHWDQYPNDLLYEGYYRISKGDDIQTVETLLSKIRFLMGRGLSFKTARMEALGLKPQRGLWESMRVLLRR